MAQIDDNVLREVEAVLEHCQTVADYLANGERETEGCLRKRIRSALASLRKAMGGKDE